ncbi:MAG: lysophospholipid acyltransferase family protein [Gemmatimonadales bacterium]
MRQLIALIVRGFFRRVAVLGVEHVPVTGPVLFVLNHPNSLVDPLLLLAFAPRRVVFLAKEPLFRIPVIGWLTRAAGSIPVYRRQDGADPSQNRRTFDRVRQALSNGGAIALFPEGTSHSDPRMRPFKTGTARMALAAASLDQGATVCIVPGGLYYTAKVRFRSSALLCFGEPIAVASEPLGADGEPAPKRVRALTARLEAALSQITLQADQEDAVRMVTRAERIFSSPDATGTGDRDLARQFELRQRFLRGYGELRRTAPALVERVERMLAHYDAELTAAGLAPESLPDADRAPGAMIRSASIATLTLLLLAPLAVVGIVIHYPAYRLTGRLVIGPLKAERDVIATTKIVAAATIFPLLWLAIAAIVWRRANAGWAVAVLLAAPCTGYAALLFIERIDRVAGLTRGLVLRRFRPTAFRRLEAQRRKIRDAILDLSRKIDDRR